MPDISLPSVSLQQDFLLFDSCVVLWLECGPTLGSTRLELLSTQRINIRLIPAVINPPSFSKLFRVFIPVVSRSIQLSIQVSTPTPARTTLDSAVTEATIEELFLHLFWSSKREMFGERANINLRSFYNAISFDSHLMIDLHSPCNVNIFH